MVKMKKLVVLVAVLLISGCADKSSSIKPTYVTPMQYERYTCGELAQEITRITKRAGELSGQQDSTATKDAVSVGAAVVFWPAAFFILAGDDSKAEIAQLKGSYIAVREVVMQKKCKFAPQLPILP